MSSRLGKRLLRSELGLRVVCRIASTYIRLARATSRFELSGDEHPRELWERNQAFLVVFWHGRMHMAICAWPKGRPGRMLNSAHRDGELMARTFGHLGLGTITGSSTRGGTGALRGILRSLQEGVCVSITPDGPRGPRMRVTGGVIEIARKAGVPILPLTWSARRARRLSTWDRFLFCYPFSSGVVMWGEPLLVPADTDAAGCRRLTRQLEDALNALTARADRACGREPVEPAPLSDEAALTPPTA